MRPVRLIFACAVLCFVAVVCLQAQEPVLVVTGTLKWYDGTVAPNQPFDVVKMSEQGRELEILSEGKVLPPPASGRSDKDGKFRVEVPKDQFGGAVMRFGFRAPLSDGAARRYARWQDGSVAVLSIDFTATKVDLDKQGKEIFLKKP